jgi:hypothetical protein
MDNKQAEELKPYNSMIQNLLLVLPLEEIPVFCQVLLSVYYSTYPDADHQALAP